MTKLLSLTSGQFIEVESTDITSLGTITTGVWNGTALGSAYVPDHDDLNGVTANEHIDWTGASEDFSTTGDLTVDTDTFYVDTSNSRIGAGTNSPDAAFHCVGLTSDNLMAIYESDRAGTYSRFKCANSGTASTSNRTGIGYYLETDTVSRVAFLMETNWEDITDATRTSRVGFKSIDSGSIGESLTLIGYDVSIPRGDLTVDLGTFHVDSTNERVGIGTTSPSYSLDVIGQSGSYIVSLSDEKTASNALMTLVNTAAASTSAGSGFDLKLNSSTNERTAFRFVTSFSDITDATRTSKTDFTVSDNGSFTEAMTLDGTDVLVPNGDFTVDTDTFHVDSTNDKVGIGTTSPSEELEVDGNVLADQYKLDALNTAPSSASDTGTLGEIRVTADYIYVCTATDTWKRSAIATW